MEDARFTATSHQVAIKMLWFHFSKRSCQTSIFTVPVSVQIWSSWRQGCFGQTLDHTFPIMQFNSLFSFCEKWHHIQMVTHSKQVFLPHESQTEYTDMDKMTAPWKWSQSVSIATWWLAAESMINPASSKLKYTSNKLFSNMVPVTLGKSYLPVLISNIKNKIPVSLI